MEEIFSRCEPIFCKFLLSDKFVTGKYKLVSEEVPILNLKDRSRVVYPNNSPVIKYKQNDESSCCFGILASDFAAVGGFYE